MYLAEFFDKWGTQMNDGKFRWRDRLTELDVRSDDMKFDELLKFLNIFLLSLVIRLAIVDRCLHQTTTSVIIITWSGILME